MTPAELRKRLVAQDFLCAYPHDHADSARLRPGDRLALAYDNYGLVHLACAEVGLVPGPLAAPTPPTRPPVPSEICTCGTQLFLSALSLAGRAEERDAFRAAHAGCRPAGPHSDVVEWLQNRS